MAHHSVPDMNAILSIGSALNNAEQRRCNIYISPGDLHMYPCHHCGVYSNTPSYAWVCPWPLRLNGVGYVRGRYCSICIRQLRRTHSARLEHLFEMYKIIRCIHSDVATYMLKFVFIPSIVDVPT